MSLQTTDKARKLLKAVQLLRPMQEDALCEKLTEKARLLLKEPVKQQITVELEEVADLVEELGDARLATELRDKAGEFDLIVPRSDLSAAPPVLIDP